MRPSPVAPAPTGKRQKKSSKNSSNNSNNNNDVVDQQQNTSPTTASHAMNNITTLDPPTLVASSSVDEDTMSMEEEEQQIDNNGDSSSEDDYDDDDDDDPYTYSDDSASLSDAYFLQPSHDPGVFNIMSDTESERDTLEISNITSPMKRKKSIPKKKSKFSRTTDDQRSTTLSSPIDEEEPVNESTSLLQSRNHTGVITTARQGTTSATTYKHRQQQKRRRLKKQRQNLMLKQQQHHQLMQHQRERAVSEVRGQPQPATWTDRFWLLLFIMQLLFVCGCAVKYGLTLTKSSVVLPAEDVLSSSLIYSQHFTTSKRYGLLGVSQPSSDSNNKTKSLPINHSDNNSMSTGSSSASSYASETTSLKEKNLEHLQDDDYVHPEIPKDQSQNLRSKKKPTTTITVTTQSSTSSASTTTTTDSTGDTVVVVHNAPFMIDYKNVLSLLLISGLYACIISYLSFSFMLIVARSLIPIMLIFTILLLLCWGVFGLTVSSYGGSMISIVGFSFFGLSLAYAMVSWNRIPFCSTNLYTAICAMRSSILILLVGVFSLFVALLWLFIWSIAVMGIFNVNNSTDCAIWDQCDTHVVILNGRVLELGVLLISLYWTTMVIKNIVRVTTAGAIGTWWFAETDSAIFDPLVRACTSSLGTIAFGSLVAFPAQAISIIGHCLCLASTGAANEKIRWASTPTKRMSSSSEEIGAAQIEEAANEQKEMLNAVAKKISQEKKKRCSWLQPLGRKLQACNRWSYTYIGMYNYSFIEGGEKAIQLFETREWMDIVRDNLIQNILLMASIVIGGSSGLVSVVVEEMDGYYFTSLHQPIVTSFWIGFVLGFVLSNVLLLGVVGSAVNTILVNFAAHPFEFDRNHPRLSREMREVWSQQVWSPEDEVEH
jgi:hypothetical protein